jgi:TonB family protein
MLVFALTMMMGTNALAVEVPNTPDLPLGTPRCYYPRGASAWVSQLSPDEHVEYYPKEYLAKGEAGYAILNCNLRGDGSPRQCAVQTASSAAFAQASLKIAHRFKVAAVGDPKAAESVPACLALYWTPGGIREGAIPPVVAPRVLPMPAAPRAASVITRPDWLRRPDGGDLEKLYPAAALEKGIEGRASISCSVTGEGALFNCAVLTEAPPDMGFGAATLGLASRFRMRAQTADGRSVAGARVIIPVTWKLAEGPPPEPAAPPPTDPAPH